MSRFLCTVMACLALLMPAVAASSNNPYGVMTLTGGSDTAGLLMHLKLARELVGEWGYVRVGMGFSDTAIDELEEMLVCCRAFHLIPVVTGLRLSSKFYDPGNSDAPKRDADGSLISFSGEYERWVRKLYDRGVTIPYFEYGNEVNGGYYAEHPEVYADMCIAASKAFKAVDPSISFGTAGMAGCALDFYETMLSRRPELVKHVDHWGFHPYGVNHPPGYAKVFDNYGLDCDSLLAELLIKHGVRDPVLIATETNYELGNQRDRRFPKITEELRARYLVDAYANYWVPSPYVRAIMLFVLQDVRWQGWNGWDLVREDYSLTPAFEAIRDAEKPTGQDYLPRGTASVRGRISDTVLDRGVEDYVVWIRGDGGLHYAAITGPDGMFHIEGIPEGNYRIRGHRSGFGRAGEAAIVVAAGQTAEWNAKVGRGGLAAPIEGPDGTQAPSGYTASLDGHEAAMDASVRRNGASSLRMEANGKVATVWQVTGYESVLPGRAYAAEVWVRTKDLVPGKGAGAALNVQVTDSYARELATAEVPLGLSGTNDWTPITLVVAGPPQARRLWVSMKLDAESGTAWFDDIFVHEASWPLPSAVGFEGSGKAHGVVTGDSGFGQSEYLSDALVFTIPYGKWARTDALGRYTIEDLPPGRYRLAAFHPDFESRVTDVGVSRDSAKADLALGLRGVPDELRNPGFDEPMTHPTWFRDWSRFGTTEGMQVAGWHAGIPDHPEGFQPHSGKGYYGAVAGSNVKDGGLYQTISVEPDVLYEVSVWSYTYQTGEGVRGDAANRLGVDTTGGRNVESPYIVWTALRPSHRQWSRISLLVRPVTSRMTIYLHHQQIQGLTYICNLFDDVSVRKVGPPDRSLGASYTRNDRAKSPAAAHGGKTE